METNEEDIDWAVRTLLDCPLRKIFDTVDEVRDRLGITFMPTEAIAFGIMVRVHASPIKDAAEMELRSLVRHLVEKQKQKEARDG